MNMNLPKSPFDLFLSWYQDAVDSKTKLPEAMTLATSTSDGRPSARIVLYKGLSPSSADSNPRGVSFYTNYQSRKAEELNHNPQAALVFYWAALDRQLRIEGPVERVPTDESDEYWNTRPRESKLSAMTSQQSQAVENRAALETRFAELTKEFEGREVPRPEHWGGYAVIPTRFEFWVNGAHRLHDRYCYEWNSARSEWVISRLSP